MAAGRYTSPPQGKDPVATFCTALGLFPFAMPLSGCNDNWIGSEAVPEARQESCCTRQSSDGGACVHTALGALHNVCCDAREDAM
jgi:hypothetical protein